MNLFNKLVDEALKNRASLRANKIVVEKELLHHDILRTLLENQLLHDLTFIGGTCLRTCYNGERLSEDLDFTGGKNFSRSSLAKMGKYLSESLYTKYGFETIVNEPVKDTGNVDTWKVKIITRPKQGNIPTQKINIDICTVPSYSRQPMLLINPYGVNMGTSTLIIQAQSLDEIYTDKLLAFALRPNRVKYRDLWDIMWLHQKGINPDLNLIQKKLNDRDLSKKYFLENYKQRIQTLTSSNTMAKDFIKEMQRFLSIKQVNQVLKNDDLWSFIMYLMNSFISKF